MKILLSFLIPLVLAVAGFVAYRVASGLYDPAWDEDKVYAVWIEDMEVAARPSGDGKWDDDGSGPDLVASLEWRDNLVLKTPEASNTLLARWERTAVQLSDLLKSNFSPTELENIARIRANGSEALVIEARDVDLLSTQWIGGISIPCGSLKLGKNRISVGHPDSGIRAVTLRVAAEENLQRGEVPDCEFEVFEGVAVLTKPVEDAPGAVEVREVGKQLESGAKFLKGLFEGGSE